MFFTARKPSLDLALVLELSRGPDGHARGQVDGVAVALGPNGTLHIPLGGSWPGALVTVPEPAASEPGHPALRLQSGHPGWMAAALKRALCDAPLRTALEALPQDSVRVDVHDHALELSFLEAKDGPSVRRAARAITRLARALPGAMAEVVDAGVRAELQVRSLSTARRTSPPSPEERLSQQYDRFVRRYARATYLGVFTPVVILFAVTFLLMGARLRGPAVIVIAFLTVLVSFGVGMVRLRRMRFTDPCPRCGAPRSTLAVALLDEVRCPSCQLRPLRPPRLIRARDLDVG